MLIFVITNAKFKNFVSYAYDKYSNKVTNDIK